LNEKEIVQNERIDTLCGEKCKTRDRKTNV
jgi:hypothetical protein